MGEVVEGFEVFAAAARGCTGTGGQAETFLAVFDYRVPARHFEAGHGAVGVEEGVGGVSEYSVGFEKGGC